jgi:hypothetical protein
MIRWLDQLIWRHTRALCVELLYMQHRHARERERWRERDLMRELS